MISSNQAERRQGYSRLHHGVLESTYGSRFSTSGTVSGLPIIKNRSFLPAIGRRAMLLPMRQRGKQARPHTD